MSSRRIAASTLILLVALAFLPGLAAQVRKVALVIGNANYASRPLRNPANDAEDLAAALRGIGFTVSLAKDASKKTMYQLVDQFGADIRGAEIALFYYSGHGVQANGENYLIPVGAEISLASDVEIEGVQLARIMGRLNAGGAGTNVVILDACRNNPFPQASKGMEKGLAVVGAKPPESLIVYATEAGETADDGTGRNGIFTAALLRNIKRSEEFTAILRDVNAEVRQETGQKQKPAKYDNLTRAVYLAGAGSAAAPAASAPPSASPASPTLTVKRSYGSLSISAVTTGTLYLDGKSMGELPAGSEATLDGIEVGEHSLELRYAGGEKEIKAATVQKGQGAAVVFSWKKAAPPAAPSAPSALPAGFVLVPGGSFTMGSPANEAGRDNDEVQHEVRLSGFAMATTEVTVGQFREFVGATGYRTSAESSGTGGYVYTGGSWAEKADASWKNPYFTQSDREPVVLVSWYDAIAYCNWKSQNEGRPPAYAYKGAKDFRTWPSGWNTKTHNEISCDFSATGYRLPTEAEWEYAAKGGQAAKSLSVNAVYAGSASLDQVAWHSGNSGSRTHPVGEKAANALGLYDMVGNVWEWCWDWYGGYASGSQSDPAGAPSGVNRVLRGGGWFNVARNLRSAFRNNIDPWFRFSISGFRLVVPQIGM